ncbi:MAG: 4-hydroxy-tetrahydrodipicolinate reductase, partial [Desulforhopalus sp.]
MTKVIIAGAAGRMGRRIAHMVNQHPSLEYGAAFEAPGNPAIGQDAGMVSVGEKNGVTIKEGLGSVIDDGDVIIDFTFHEATMEFARMAASHHRAMVIG